IPLDMIGNQDHDNIGGLGGAGGAQDFQAGGLGLRPRLTALVEADHHVDPGIAKVQRVGMALASVSHNGHSAAAQMLQVSIFFVKASWHSGSSKPHRQRALGAPPVLRNRYRQGPWGRPLCYKITGSSSLTPALVGTGGCNFSRLA